MLTFPVILNTSHFAGNSHICCYFEYFPLLLTIFRYFPPLFTIFYQFCVKLVTSGVVSTLMWCGCIGWCQLWTTLPHS